MDKPHKRINTTSPVAIKFGQGRIHVRGGDGPWHESNRPVPCPTCTVKYVVDNDMTHEFVIKKLVENHVLKQEHPDVIYSDPQDAKRVIACDCEA